MAVQTSHDEASPDPKAADAVDQLQHPQTTQFSEKLTEALRNLPCKDFLFVDSHRQIFLDKSEIVNNERPPLATFRKDLDGSFTVYSGLPPRNSSYCGSGHPTTDRNISNTPAISSPVYLSSGDWIALSPTLTILIPTHIEKNPQTPAQKLSHLIASTQVGKTVTLGRAAVPECPREVSRAHITVHVIERTQLSPTTVCMRIIAAPGVEGSERIYELKPNGERYEIFGNRKVAAGATMQLGASGECVTLPYSKGSLNDVSILMQQSILLGDRNRADSYSHKLTPKDQREVAFKNFKDFVVKALDMIRDGNPNGALEHLRTESTQLRAAGYELRENNYVGLLALTREAVAHNLLEVSKRSWFQENSRLIYPSTGGLKGTLSPHTKEEHELVDLWRKHLALIYAEEYVHALQHFAGGAISGYEALFGVKGSLDHEADVALLFMRHGIDLSDGIYLERYPERIDAAKRVEGYQTAVEEQYFAQKLIRAPIDTPVMIPYGATIIRDSSNNYTVAPLSPHRKVFFVRDREMVTEITKATKLEGNTTLFLGLRKFILPAVSRDESAA